MATNKSPLDPDAYTVEYDYGVGAGAGENESFVLTPEQMCCMYPSSGTDCLCMSNTGCPLSGYLAGRVFLLFFGICIVAFTLAAGVLLSVYGSCTEYGGYNGNYGSCGYSDSFKDPAAAMCFVAASAALIAFCTSCAFLASLSWLYGARLNHMRAPSAASNKALFLYNRKDTNLNIILFSFHLVTLLFVILALAFDIVYQIAEDGAGFETVLLVLSLALSCVVVIMQPFKGTGGQTLCAKSQQEHNPANVL